MGKERTKTRRDWSTVLKKMNEQSSGGASFVDERIYQPEFKEDCPANATIRFLEAPDSDVPMVPVYSHYFRGIGGYFINNCPTTLGSDCPVCEDNSAIWKTGKEGEAFVRRRQSSRTLSYYSNIIVIKDDKNPENVGKVFIYRFGKKVYEKIDLVLKAGFVPWDEDYGMNFNIIITKKKIDSDSKPQNNYDGCYFTRNEYEEYVESPLSKYADMKKLELYPLLPFIDESKFLAYDVLKAKFNKVVGEKSEALKSNSSEALETPKASKKKTVETIEDDVEQDETPEVDFGSEKVFEDDDTEDFLKDLDIE